MATGNNPFYVKNGIDAGNVTINTTSIAIGNTVINAVSISTGAVNAASLTIGQTTVNTTTLSTGTVNAASVAVGDTTINTSAFSSTGVYTLGSGSSVITDAGGSIALGGSAVVNGYIRSGTMPATNIYTSYTLQNSDSGTALLCTNASSTITITIPNTFPTFARVLITRLGGANVNIAGSTGLGVASRTGNFNVLNQWGSISVLMVNSSTAIIDGNV